MRSGQMKLWVDQPKDSETVWPTLSDADRTQVARVYAKAIGKAARVRGRQEAGREAEDTDDSST
jgi:hypothetical protein